MIEYTKVKMTCAISLGSLAEMLLIVRVPISLTTSWSLRSIALPLTLIGINACKEL